MRAFDRACQLRLPVIAVTATGGVRLQEGMLALVQMGRTAAARSRHAGAGRLAQRAISLAGQLSLPVLTIIDTPGAESDSTCGTTTFHVPQVLNNIPGVTGARRFAISDAPPTPSMHRYLAVYDIEADQPGEVVRALGEAVAAGRST